MNEVIYYKSPVGVLCIRNEADAISAVSFINTEMSKRVSETEMEYNAPHSPILKKCIEQLDNYFAGTAMHFDLNLSQPGTAFQQSVWVALGHIGYGKTISYLALSKNLGNVKAIRAVGTANGKNNIAIIVPCHRVIGSNGTLVGYAGDLWRKKWLLDHEAKFFHGVQKLF